MSYHNIRDKFGRFAKKPLAPIPTRKRTKKLHSNDYLILDRSGSMASILDSTINSINEYFQTLILNSKKVSITSYIRTFTHVVEHLRSIDLTTFRPWTRRDYIPNGSTALYDALGQTLDYIIANYKPGEQYVVTVITDGQENASRSYNNTRISNLVEIAKGMNITVNYIGAGDFIDVQAAGQSIGIFASNILNYTADNAGVTQMSAKLQNARSVAVEKYATTGENTNIGFFSN